MQKQIFLHIGMKKAASTSIQSFLQKNAKALVRVGYFFPWHTNLAKQASLAFIFRNNPLVRVNADWEEFHQVIASSSCNHVAISSESFESRDISYIEAVQHELSRYKVKIIIYLRRQDLRVESHYLQSVKSGAFTGSIQSYLEKYQHHHLDYLSLLSAWQKCFGKQNIIVRALEKTQIPDVCIDFLNILGLNQDSNFKKLDASRNVKLAYEQMIAVNFINNLMAKKTGHTGEGFFRMDLNHDFNRKYHLPLVRFIQDKDWTLKTSYKVLPYENAKEILERYKESNQEVARRYFDRADGVLFYEDLVREYDVEDLDIRNLSQEYLIDIFSFLIN